MVGVPGVAYSAGMLVMAGRPEGKFHHVETRDIQCTRRIKAMEGGGGCRGLIILADDGATGGNPALTVIHVLMCQRHTVQQADGLTGCQQCICICCIGQCRLRVRTGDAVQPVTKCINPCETGFGQLDGGKVTFSDTGSGGFKGEIGESSSLFFGAESNPFICPVKAPLIPAGRQPYEGLYFTSPEGSEYDRYSESCR